MPDGGPKQGGARAIALVGPYASGKTTLMEAMLHATGAIGRMGATEAGTTVGDASAEARARKMSVEANFAAVDFMGDRYHIVDCPGSVEFQADALGALGPVDAAVVVCEPDPAKAGALQPILRELAARGIPHWLFVNKIDKASGRVRDLLETLQPYAPRPLVLRQAPIWESGVVTGYIDLALKRAYVYREHAASQLIQEAAPDAVRERLAEARYDMLEKLSEYDDHLMEELLEDIEPPMDEIFDQLARDLAEGLITPVLLGAAERHNGVRRLLKALRHEGPAVAETALRVGAQGDDVAMIVKTLHTQHGGKQSVARVLRGRFVDGDTVTLARGGDARIAGLFRLHGAKSDKIAEAVEGDLVAFGRLEEAATGEVFGKDASAAARDVPHYASPPPVFAFAIAAADRKDEVKLSDAIRKLCDEDPSLRFERSPETNEMLLQGQGEVHLQVAAERLKSKFGLALDMARPKTAYRETIRKGARAHGRHKKQSGGHGQFGDVVIEVKPLPRGSGFAYDTAITGGAIPKTYFSAVEAGIRDYMARGPLGFPMVDLAVTLVDGSTHSVDSSDQAFRAAGRIAMAEAAGQCAPVLLEPIMDVEVDCPSETTARINAIISARRGQILGFDAREGWEGWDTVRAHMPQADLHDLIIELRSATQGAGGYRARFDHMAELTGRQADAVIAAAKEAADA